jgi:hypothetical protein
MSLRHLIRRRIRRKDGGVEVQGDVNAVVAANVGENGGSTSVSSKQRVVHRSGRASFRTER